MEKRHKKLPTSGIKSDSREIVLCAPENHALGCHALKEQAVDFFDGFRLREIYDHPAIGIFAVAEEPAVCHADLAVERPDVLFLKIAFDAVFFGFAYGRQAVHGVAGKAAHALGHDEVNFPGKRVVYHGLEADALLCRSR